MGSQAVDEPAEPAADRACRQSGVPSLVGSELIIRKRGTVAAGDEPNGRERPNASRPPRAASSARRPQAAAQTRARSCG